MSSLRHTLDPDWLAQHAAEFGVTGANDALLAFAKWVRAGCRNRRPPEPPGSQRSLILEALRKHGPMTRKQIAAVTGLSYFAVARTIKDTRTRYPDLAIRRVGLATLDLAAQDFGPLQAPGWTEVFAAEEGRDLIELPLRLKPPRPAACQVKPPTTEAAKPRATFDVEERISRARATAGNPWAQLIGKEET